MDDDQGAQSAFEFSGHWREFLPIALTNLLLTIVTLGFYRFWATARERRYLWGQTRFIDDRLEWSGTGLELFIGFLMVIAAIFAPLFLLQFVAQALILQGQAALAIALTIILYLLLFYLIGVARFRALRYRLSRSWWHGIRGGSDDQGLAYGWSYMWKTILGFLPFGLAIPWSMSSLWNQRWNAMSFGIHPFRSEARWANLYLRFIICYAVPWAAMIGLGIAMIPAMMMGGSQPGPALFAVIGFAVLAIYLILPLCALAFYAAFLREAIGALRLAGLDFAFAARTKNWLWLFLGNAGLWVLAMLAALVPLAAFGAFAVLRSGPEGMPFQQNGMGLIVIAIAFIIPFAIVGPFIRYRNWRFFILHLEAGGEIDLDALTQSETRTARQGEGLLDAFDVGAI